MVALMAGIAIMIILSAVAAQKWTDVVRRDNEAEMMFRAQDIVRGLKRFQKDRGRLPSTWDELMDPGQKGQYFLRKRWKDPLVKGGKWQILYAGPQGGVIDPTALSVDPGAGGAPPFGGSSPFGGSPPPTGTPSQPGAANPSTLIPVDVTNQSSSPTGRAPGAAGVGAIVKKDDGTSELAGLPIAGVKSRCSERTFRVYKDKDEYSQWLFSVFDLEQPQTAVTTPAAPGAPGAPGTPPPASSGAFKGTPAPPTFPPR
jgi:type II secretory pathway pseudopilin PulG